MENDPRDITNPIMIDTVVAGSATALTSDEYPGKVILKVQAVTPRTTNLRTFLFPVDPADARQLHAALSKFLKGTAN